MRSYIEAKSKQALSRTNPVIAKLSKDSGVSCETIYRAALGDRVMSRFSAEKVSKATRGKLPVAVLLGLEKPAKRAK